MAKKHDSAAFKRMQAGNAGSSGGGEEWLLTYADTVTLLMTFMVLMLAMSTIDQSKFEQTSEAIKEGALRQEAEKSSPFEVLKQEVETVAIENQVQDAVTVTRVPKGLNIEFSSSALYSAGSAEIRDDAFPILEHMAETLREFKHDNHEIEVEGHTDDVPISTPRYPSNWELSVHRATNIVRFLTEKGISKERMKAAGYADTRPKAPNLEPDGQPITANRALNRRIVIHVYRR